MNCKRALPIIVIVLATYWGVAPAQGDLKQEVDLRILAWQPTPAERKIDEIGWAKDIRSALRLGTESARPIFLFTHDGRMGVGRQ